MRPYRNLLAGLNTIISLVVAVVLCSSVACRAEQDPGLVAHYTFEEGPGGVIKDHSGTGNDGNNLGANYVKLPDGKGYALKFGTPEAHVDCGNTPSLDLRDAVTLSLWFYPETAVTKGEAGVVGKIMGSYCMSYSGKCWFYTPGGSNYSSTAVLGKEWNHLVATFDGKYSRFYRNGRLEGVTESKVRKLPAGENFYLRYPATYLPPVEPAMVCTMDDVRVYNRALSEAEVAEQYRETAKSSGRHDVTWFDRPKLTLHKFPVSETLYVEINHRQMAAIPNDAKARIEVRNANGKAVLAETLTIEDSEDGEQEGRRAEFSDTPMTDIIDHRFSVAGLPAGNYVIDVSVTTGKGALVGQSSSATLELPLAKPAWVAAYDDVKILNNMVAELLNVQADQTKATRVYSFTNPRDGWVFVSSTAAARGRDTVAMSIDDTQVSMHADGKKQTLEAMRHLSAGKHTLTVKCNGSARPTSLIVRAIPELLVPGLGYATWVKPYGNYNMKFLKRCGLLDNLNVIIERTARSEDAAAIAAWADAGKRRLVRHGMYPLYIHKNVTPAVVFKDWSDSRGLNSPDYQGVIVDEFSGSGHGGIGKYPAYSQVIRRIAGDAAFDGKVLYPYCMPMHTSKLSMDMLEAVVDSGYKWAEEKYLSEQVDEQQAMDYMDRRYVRNTLRYNGQFPGAARHMVMVPGYMSAPPETLNINPAADFKAYMDMQMHMFANNPALFGLYGVQWYHLAYADEEDVRFTAKLFRHYCIEGRKDRLTDDPYMLPHIVNPDFDEGDAGWTLEPVEPGGVATGHSKGYGKLQTRCAGGDEDCGDNFLVTKRSAKAPNRFSQQIRQLTPGRTYSVKMFTADYDHIKKGKSDQKKHHISISVNGVDMIPAKEIHHMFPSGQAGHMYPPFDRENNLYVTYHRVVFRAKDTTAMLTISDWASDADPGGPVGQELMHNFIEVQPYLDDSDLPPLKQVQPKKAAPPAAAVPNEEAIRNAPDSTPVARYGFDEGKGNVAGSAADGPEARIYGATHVKRGDGYALSFDGTDDYVTVPANNALSIGGSNLTVECWFKIGDLKATWRGLCGNYRSGLSGYMLVYTSHSVAFYSGAATNGPSCSIDDVKGPWHHAVGVVDNGTMAVYVDGVKQKSSSHKDQKIVPSDYPFDVGRFGAGNNFSGEIDDVAVYDTAMTYAEIVKRYRKGRR